MKAGNFVAFVLKAYCLLILSSETSSYSDKSNSFTNIALMQTEL